MLRFCRNTLLTGVLLFTGMTMPSFTEEGTAAVECSKKALTPTEVSRVSEAFGHLIGRNLESPGIKFNLECIIKGMRDAVAGKEPPMTEEEYEDIMTLIQETAFNELAATNLRDAESFMKEIAHEENIKVLEEGKLQYRVLLPGQGKSVEEHSNPVVNYRGCYLDGTVFGSSDEAGGPVAIPLDQTIPGFSKGLVGMKEGEKRKIYVHPDLGYGTSGHMPPNTLLVFEVEVVNSGYVEEAEATVDAWPIKHTASVR